VCKSLHSLCASAAAFTCFLSGFHDFFWQFYCHTGMSVLFSGVLSAWPGVVFVVVLQGYTAPRGECKQ
jgi:hypothetical protein